MADRTDPLAWLHSAPAGTLVSVEAVRALLADRSDAPRTGSAARPSLDSWRERLWSAPAETRIGPRELAAAVGHSVSWTHKHVNPKHCTHPIPHRKVEGELVFVVQEVREWLQAREVRVEEPAAAVQVVSAVVSLTERRRRG